MFKKIPGYKDYAISELGIIISLKYNKKEYMHPAIVNGYKQIKLFKNGIKEYKKIGHLILLTFIGPCPEGMQMSHLNGNSLDDRLENLKWETPFENQQRKIMHGKSTRGEKNPGSKLKNKDVIQIRKLIKVGYKLCLIQKMFNVSRSTIYRIKHNINWEHIQLKEKGV